VKSAENAMSVSDVSSKVKGKHFQPALSKLGKHQVQLPHFSMQASRILAVHITYDIPTLHGDSSKARTCTCYRSHHNSHIFPP
jgi:hypothetical protein